VSIRTGELMERELQVLVVDDDDALRQVIANLLEPKFHVHTASGGIEAFELVKKHQIDIVLSDMCMAEGSGGELLSWIRARDPEKPVVVLVTGYAQITKEEALEKGARALVSKPFSRKSLLNLIYEVAQQLEKPGEL
jgi:CheY-like chemotaxis protein